jgi:DNA-binding GntR family transcriptional regulator
LAAQLAAANRGAEDDAVLQTRLSDLEAAAGGGDMGLCTRCDMALHQAIWHQADNPHLLRVLDSVLGAIFVLCDRLKVHASYNAENVVREHRRLVTLIGKGAGAGAGQAMEVHLRNALDVSLRILADLAQADD